MRRIGIVGSRSRNSKGDKEKVRKAFLAQFESDEDWIVSGGCPEGGDRFAEEFAKEYQVPILIFYAQWRIHGRSAGFIRNTPVAEWSDVLIACVARSRKGGTEDTIEKFEKLGKGKAVIV